MAACSSCRAAIVWARTSSGRRIPIDNQPTLEGNIVLSVEQIAPAAKAVTAAVLSGADLEAERAKPGARLFRSHFVTCPDAERFRRRPVT